jgi:hypothetical protein
MIGTLDEASASTTTACNADDMQHCICVYLQASSDLAFNTCQCNAQRVAVITTHQAVV